MPVLTPAQLIAIEEGGRHGFTLSGNFPANVGGSPYPAILLGDTNDASSGFPILLVDGTLIAENGYSLVTNTIFRTSGTVNNSALGFTNGLTSYNGLVDFDVQWGLWGPGQFLRIYTNPADDYYYSDVTTNMIWAGLVDSQHNIVMRVSCEVHYDH